MKFQGLSNNQHAEKSEGYWTILWSVALLPFFEPWSVDYLILQGYHAYALTIVTSFNIVARALISLFAAAYFIRRFKLDIHMKCLAAVAAAMAISSIASPSSSSLPTIVNAFQYMGFAALLSCMLRENERRAICSLFMSFGLIAIAAVLSATLTNGGFLASDDPASAVYSFGGKNSIFITLLPFVLTLGIYLSLQGKKSLAILPPLVSFIFAALSFYVQSASSTICFLASALLLIPKGETLLFRKAIRSDYLSIGLLFTFVSAVLTSLLPDLLEHCFALIGRDSSFTGRTFLWKAAKGAFLSNPYIGEGPGITYYSEAGTYMGAQAHCTILDLLAKYGLLTTVPFFLDIALGIKNERAGRNAGALSPESPYAIAGFMLLLFHGMFDDTPFYFYLAIRAIYLRFGCPRKDPVDRHELSSNSKHALERMLPKDD